MAYIRSRLGSRVAVAATRAAQPAGIYATAVGKRGGKSGSYDDWTVDDLRERAAELDIDGRSSMSKDELIDALRNH